MLFDPRFRNHVDYRSFTHDSPCVWIVYQAGTGGDLWASIVGLHYPRTGNHFLGIDNTGRVILDTIDQKWLNINQHQPIDEILGNELLHQVNNIYSSQNFPYSMSGQCIFANHLWRDHYVEQIVERFPLARIIRITSSSNFERRIAEWMSAWKNKNKLLDFDSVKDQAPDSLQFQHLRLLDLSFGELWSPNNFENAYSAIIKHLGLCYKLVRYDLIKFWYDQQHEIIKPHLLKLFE